MKSSLLLILVSATCLGILIQACIQISAKPALEYENGYRNNIVSCMGGGAENEEWKTDPDAIPALPGWGNFSWKISTKNDSAQFYFNQGINMFYSYHMIEARASFAKASTFDAKTPLPYWGIAMALAPNINFTVVSPEARADALKQIAKAKANLTAATNMEKDLVAAVANRFSTEPNQSAEVLNRRYAEAMKAFPEKYPTDANAFALYADALMVEHPWDLYEQNGAPKSWTPPIVTVLREGLAAYPNHPGLNHYFIHAIEASNKPSDAIPSADLLSKLMPSVSHMVHMPSHIYIRTGNYKEGIAVNKSALKGYEVYSGLYSPVSALAFIYQNHNQHMQLACALMQGSYTNAMQIARELAGNIPLDYRSDQSAFANYFQYMYAAPQMVYIRYGRWKELLDLPPVNEKLHYEYAFQLFAQGLAMANTGKLERAKENLAKMIVVMADPVLAQRYEHYANSGLESLLVGRYLLEGVIAQKQGLDKVCLQNFELAVKYDDQLKYAEPRDWLLPARHYYGQALLDQQKFAKAQIVFEEDLRQLPMNGFAYYGLMQAHDGQQKIEATKENRLKYQEAFEGGDTKLKSALY